MAQCSFGSRVIKKVLSKKRKYVPSLRICGIFNVVDNIQKDANLKLQKITAIFI